MPSRAPDLNSFHALFNGAENALAFRVRHIDLDNIAEAHQLCTPVHFVDLLDHTPLQKAGRASRPVAVRDSARAEDRASAERAGLGSMGNKFRIAEMHLSATIRITY